MDADLAVNVRQRATNLNANSPFSSWKSLLEAVLGAVRKESLDTGVAEPETNRDARRVRINELTQQLLDELKDPTEMYIHWHTFERPESKQ